ncbi:MAG: hypothetical protein CFE34_10650 [Rhodobacteraceae bacterium PARR1]|nr:MAG: hypothetical protein CFE34_10650 [Rhodobacteraceae bacterium PARR1]
MFLKKVDGPRHVTLPDGTILTRADLPPPDTTRWIARRKALVVRAVAHGLLSQDEAVKRYGLSDEEFSLWCKAIADHGEAGLRVTKLKTYR